jgi:hypothetical protein
MAHVFGVSKFAQGIALVLLLVGASAVAAPGVLGGATSLNERHGAGRSPAQRSKVGRAARSIRPR